MKRILQNWDIVIILVMYFFFISIMSYYSILRHDAFASGFDLANMDQTVWNTAQGRFFTLSGPDGETISRFSIHADLILALLAPLYMIWENVRFLLIIEVVCMGLAGIPLYLIAHHILKDKVISIGLVALFFINTGIQWALIYDFHPVTLAVLFLFTAFYALLKQKWWLYFISLGLALLTKEHVGLTVTVLGLVASLYFKERRIGILTMILGLTWTFMMIFFVMPAFSTGGSHWAFEWFTFGHQEETGLTLPQRDFIYQRFFEDQSSKEYYKMLFEQYGYLPLIGLPWLILSLPDFMINMLSSQGQMRSIYFHYDALISFGMMLSVIYGLFYLKKIVPRYIKHAWIRPLIVFAIFGGGFLIGLKQYYYFGPLPITPACWCFIYDVSEEDKQFEALLQQIPQDKSVTASPEIRPHITHREKAFTLPTATESADFVAIIDQNRMVGNFDSKEFELELIEKLNQSTTYKLNKHIGHFYLYEKIQ